MTSARDEAKRNFLNALKALVFEGRPCDWVMAMSLLAIPIAFSFNLSALLNSIIINVFGPMIWHPILRAANIENLTHLTMGGLRIGAVLDDITSVCFNGIMLFALTRFLRRSI